MAFLTPSYQIIKVLPVAPANLPSWWPGPVGWGLSTRVLLYAGFILLERWFLLGQGKGGIYIAFWRFDCLAVREVVPGI